MLKKINTFCSNINYVLSVFLLFVVFLVLMTHLSIEVKDLDIWLHIQSGNFILQHHYVPTQDIFSFTQAGKPWINHEWLFQIVVAKFYEWMGPNGLILFQNLVFLSIFWMLFVFGFRNQNYIFLSFSFFVLLLNLSHRFTIRPDMMSALFLTIYLFVLFKTPRKIWILPLLQVIWSNCHGFFFIGPLTVLLYTLESNNRKTWAVFFACLAATTCNPQGITGALYPLSTALHLSRDRFVFEFITELGSPLHPKTIFSLTHWIFYKALILIAIFSFRLNQKHLNKSLLALWVVALLFSISAIRNIIYFAIVSIVAIFYNAHARFNDDPSFSNARFSSRPGYYIARTILIMILLVSMTKNALLIAQRRYYDFDHYNFKSVLFGESLDNFPKKAVDFLLKEPFPDRMFNDFNAGSYIIGRGFPKRRVFIDGRTELYGSAFLRDYRKASDGDTDTIERFIKQYDLQGFFQSLTMHHFDEELSKYLYNHKAWIPVYFDEQALIFLKDSPQNQHFIKKFGIDLKEWQPPYFSFSLLGPRIVEPYPQLRRAEVLRELSCFEAAAREARLAIEISPSNASAHYLLANCLKELKQYNEAARTFRVAIGLAPQQLDWRNEYAITLYKLGQLDEALRELNFIRKKLPSDPNVLHGIAMVNQAMGNLDIALQTITEAIETASGKTFDYTLTQANILRDQQQLTEALALYRALHAEEPHNEKVNLAIHSIENTLSKK